MKKKTSLIKRISRKNFYSKYHYSVDNNSKTSLIPNTILLDHPEIPLPLGKSSSSPNKLKNASINVSPIPFPTALDIVISVTRTLHPNLLRNPIEKETTAPCRGSRVVAWQIETLSSRHDRAKISLQITRILSGFPSSQVERAGKVGGIRGKRTRKPAAYVFDHVSTHGRRKKKREKQTMIVHAALRRRSCTHFSFRECRVFPKSWYDRRGGDTWVGNWGSKIYNSIYTNLSRNEYIIGLHSLGCCIIRILISPSADAIVN